ncbi:MAG: hypothetical protein HPY78_10185 [Brevinematales bacterium]|nr:hypothetical protein [Brevinematales bacterium]
MKRILGVLLVLSLVVPAFAVTGKVYMKLRDNGNSFGATSGAGWWVHQAWDMGATGFELNYDSFGIKYHFVEPGKLEVNGGNLTETGWDKTPIFFSPGYVEISGISVKPFTLGVGLITAFSAMSDQWKSTNTNGTTNFIGIVEGGGFGIKVYPRIAFIMGGLNISTADQMAFEYLTGNSSLVTDGGTTNKNNGSASVVKLGVNAKYSFGVSGEVGGYYSMYNGEIVRTTVAATNGYYEKSSELNTWADISYKLSESLSAYAKLWFKMGNTEKKTTDSATTTTNDNFYTSSDFGPEAKVVYSIAGGNVKLNLGVGAVMHNETTLETVNGATNANKSESWIVLMGVKRDDNRALLEFGGSSKFGDWEFGMTARLCAALGITKTYYEGLGTATIGTSNPGLTMQNTDSWLAWNPAVFSPLLKDVYLKYSKGMVEIKFNLYENNDFGEPNKNQSAFGTTTADPLFASVELSYKF